jgi:hypothetical protein
MSQEKTPPYITDDHIEGVALHLYPGSVTDRHIEALHKELRHVFCLGMAMARHTYEAARAKDQEQVRELREAMRECINQIEYLHEKFSTTGSGSVTILRAMHVLDKYPQP